MVDSDIPKSFDMSVRRPIGANSEKLRRNTQHTNAIRGSQVLTDLSGPRSSEVRDKVVALTEGVVFIRNRKDNELSNVSISYESEIPLYTGSHNAPVWRMGLTVKMLFSLVSLPGILNPSVPVSFHSVPLHFDPMIRNRLLL